MKTSKFIYERESLIRLSYKSNTLSAPWENIRYLFYGYSLSIIPSGTHPTRAIFSPAEAAAAPLRL